MARAGAWTDADATALIPVTEEEYRTATGRKALGTGAGRGGHMQAVGDLFHCITWPMVPALPSLCLLVCLGVI